MKFCSYSRACLTWHYQYFNFGELILEVSSTSANDAILELCDSDGTEDGFVEFDLSLANGQVLDGLPTGLNIDYPVPASY